MARPDSNAWLAKYDSTTIGSSTPVTAGDAVWYYSSNALLVEVSEELFFSLDCVGALTSVCLSRTRCQRRRE